MTETETRPHYPTTCFIIQTQTNDPAVPFFYMLEFLKAAPIPDGYVELNGQPHADLMDKYPEFISKAKEVWGSDLLPTKEELLAPFQELAKTYVAQMKGDRW